MDRPVQSVDDLKMSADNLGISENAVDMGFWVAQSGRQPEATERAGTARTGLEALAPKGRRQRKKSVTSFRSGCFVGDERGPLGGFGRGRRSSRWKGPEECERLRPDGYSGLFSLSGSLGYEPTPAVGCIPPAWRLTSRRV